MTRLPIPDTGELGPVEELLEDWFPRGALVTGTCGEASGVLLYGGEEMGVTNLLVVARVKKSSSSFIVSLLCRVSRGWRLGTMLNPSKALRVSGFR